MLQKCSRDLPALNYIQVATKITNPLKSKKKVKVNTTFTEKGEKLSLRSQQKKRTPEEDVQYRRAEIVANMVSCVCGVIGALTLYKNYAANINANAGSIKFR